MTLAVVAAIALAPMLAAVVWIKRQPSSGTFDADLGPAVVVLAALCWMLAVAAVYGVLT